MTQPLTYLALGDSYTIGEKLELKENFPWQVVSIMREHGINIDAPDIVAKTGWTTDELADGIRKTKLAASYSFVSLLIGVNDQYRGRSVNEYRPAFESLLERAIEFSGNISSHVVVLSIPDWGATPFAINRDRAAIARDIDTFNSVNKEISMSKKVNYLPVTAGTRESANDPSMLAEDGLHPSGILYRSWAVMIANIFESLRD